MTKFSIALWLVIVCAPATFCEDQPDNIHARLKPLAQFVGKVWIAGDPHNPQDGQFSDVSQWSWVLGGQAIEISHSVNGGVYQGLTLIHVDETDDSVRFRYATTGGFYTDGVIRVADDAYEARETVIGDAGNIAAVISGARISENGTVMTVWSKSVMKDGSEQAVEQRLYKLAHIQSSNKQLK